MLPRSWKTITLACLFFSVGFPWVEMGPVVYGSEVGTNSLNQNPSFRSGEQLSYRISVWGIPAGHATLQVVKNQPLQPIPTLQLRSLAKSNQFISLFFPVHNQVDSIIDAHSLMPVHFKFYRREGTRHEDFDVTFHRERAAVTVIKNGKRSYGVMMPTTLDPLSCLYFLRNLPALQPGTSVFLDVFHDSKNYRVEVQVEDIETMASPWGVIDSLPVLVIMPFKGIFLNEGNIRVWLTNDERRIPILMKARVIIGSVVARLKEFSF